MNPSVHRSSAALLAIFALAACTQLMGAPEPADGPRAITGPAGAVYVDDGGDGGLPVVFLHSFAGDASHWASQLDHLRHHRRALAIDLRGHGKSARPRDGDYSIRAFVRDLEAVVESLKLARFVLVGHSLGAAVANAYAARHPNRVAGIVLVGASGRVPAEQASKVMSALESGYEETMTRHMEGLLEGAQPRVRSELVRQLAEMPREDSIAIIRTLFADDPLPAFERYKGPRLIVFSSSSDSRNGLHHAKAQAPQKGFEGTSHWPHLDKPGEFNLMLDEFLAGIR